MKFIELDFNFNTVNRIDLTYKLKEITGFENCQNMLFSTK